MDLCREVSTERNLRVIDMLLKKRANCEVRDAALNTPFI